MEQMNTDFSLWGVLTFNISIAKSVWQSNLCGKIISRRLLLLFYLTLY